MLLAHSADLKKGIPAQNYTAHISGVVALASKAAEEASIYATLDGDLLKTVVKKAAEYHDLGKLDDSNQNVLSGVITARHLPVQHTDAGTAHLIGDMPPLAAILVRSHHIGLPDFIAEIKRDELCFRDEDPNVRNIVNNSLQKILLHHDEEMKSNSQKAAMVSSFQSENVSIFYRIALSCLTDADHTDTAIHYNNYQKNDNSIKLNPEKRLDALNSYVANLGSSSDERSKLRTIMYQCCRDSNINSGIASCDSPVGSGKTTAVMAHLLKQALKRKLRRIFVVLPYTNIIKQSVDIYRKALVLPGENPADVVAELHHRADFQDLQSRHLTSLWNAPIIVTTAVAFFETIASNTPSSLRKLHRLPGSAIFVDEAHAALPSKLLPIAWNWIKSFSNEWKCYWVLASGSLNRFWEIPEFDQKPPVIPEITPESIRNRLAVYETNRVIYRYKPQPQKPDEFVEWIASLPGPRLVILNTVQSAAAIASLYAEKFGKEQIEHLSTALTPKDREATLERIKKRLKNVNIEYDLNWTLIATSCVEAGVDISFTTGVRELGSLVSLLQTSGRVNRDGSKKDSIVWAVRLAEILPLKTHPGVQEAAQVLESIFKSNVEIKTSLCTDAMKREIRIAGTELLKLVNSEIELRFPIVEKDFRVIPGETITVLIDENVIKKLENYEKVDWKEILCCSVNIYGYKLRQLNIPEINGHSGIYKWHLLYDSFIGYMAGVLQLEAVQSGDTTII